ncbi:MAG TPA: hypothetical protein VF199_08160 [Bacillales bacterium]
MKKMILGLLSVTLLMGIGYLGTDVSGFQVKSNSGKIDQSSYEVARGFHVFYSRDEIAGR